MLTGPTLDRLHALNLAGMARALAEQRENPAYAELSFEDRLGLLVDREATERENRRLERYLRAAKLRLAASVEDVDLRAPRGLDRAVILELASARWVAAHQQVLVTGPTGVGKTYLARALAAAAIRAGHTALYARTPRLLAEIGTGRADGRLARLDPWSRGTERTALAKGLQAQNPPVAPKVESLRAHQRRPPSLVGLPHG